MIDIKFLRENPDAVKENIKKKYQDEKLGLVDEVIELDKKLRAAQLRADTLRGDRNKLSKQIGGLMAQGKKDEAEQVKAQVKQFSDELAELEKNIELIEERLEERVNNKKNVTITKDNALQVLEQLAQVLGNEEKGFYSSRLKQCMNKLKSVA